MRIKSLKYTQLIQNSVLWMGICIVVDGLLGTPSLKAMAPTRTKRTWRISQCLGPMQEFCKFLMNEDELMI